MSTACDHVLWKLWVNGRFLIMALLCISSVFKYKFRREELMKSALYSVFPPKEIGSSTHRVAVTTSMWLWWLNIRKPFRSSETLTQTWGEVREKIRKAVYFRGKRCMCVAGSPCQRSLCAGFTLRWVPCLQNPNGSSRVLSPWCLWMPQVLPIPGKFTSPC